MPTKEAQSANDQLRSLRAEASRYKTVRVDWLIKNLDRILANPLDWECDDECASFQDPIAKPKKLISLCVWLAAGKGLAPCGELTAMDAHRKYYPRIGKLVRETGGMTLDYAREAAAEEGYIPEDTTINALLDAIDEELRGRPCYTMDDLAAHTSDCPF